MILWWRKGLFIFGNKHKNNTNNLEFHSYSLSYHKFCKKREERSTFNALSIGVAIYENIFVGNCFVFINNGFTSDLRNLGKIHLCRQEIFFYLQSLSNVTIYIIHNKSIVFSPAKSLHNRTFNFFFLFFDYFLLLHVKQLCDEIFTKF